MQPPRHRISGAPAEPGAPLHPINSAELLLSLVEARCAAGNGNGNGNGMDSRARQEVEKIEEQIAPLQAAAQDDDARQEIQQLHDRIEDLRSQISAHSTAWQKT